MHSGKNTQEKKKGGGQQKSAKAQPGRNWARELDARAGREEASGSSGKAAAGGDKNSNQRLAKVLAHAGVASRRGAEALVADGRVRVNGKMVTDPATGVDPRRDVLHLDGQRVATRRPQEIKWVMLNKPKGILTTMNDEKGRRCVADLVPRAADLRLVPVGRLDRDSQGLLLLTNDLDQVHLLTHPSFEHWKTYRVVVDGLVKEESLEAFAEGLLIEGEARRTVPCTVEATSYDAARRRTVCEVKLREGRNRQIRRMFAHLGHEVRSLKRTAFGPLTLGSNLPEGQYRELRSVEVQKLREMTGKSASKAKKKVDGKQKAQQPRKDEEKIHEKSDTSSESLGTPRKEKSAQKLKKGEIKMQKRNTSDDNHKQQKNKQKMAKAPPALIDDIEFDGTEVKDDSFNFYDKEFDQDSLKSLLASSDLLVGTGMSIDRSSGGSSTQ